MDTAPDILLYAALGGILPAIFWLWCWLHEDRHPEPRAVLLSVFVCGMVAVPVAGLLQKAVGPMLSGKWPLIFAWAAIEEILKFLAAYLPALTRRYFDEPVDAMIYLITAALGFAALENTLFITSSLLHYSPIESLVTGNLRFIGASLLHVLTSGVVGAVIAIEFYKGRFKREVATVIGLILSTGLHAVFNFFIMDAQGTEVFRVFYGVWIAIVLLLIVFSRIKRISKPTFSPVVH
ncbi:MAG: PrsW family glutamic-type intramembrane protease [Patescibacteria group bacterium]